MVSTSKPAHTRLSGRLPFDVGHERYDKEDVLESKTSLSAVDAGELPATHDLLVGSLLGFLTVLMFSLWIIGTRFAVKTTLGPFDIAFVRYLTASAILLPYVLRNGLGLERAGLARSAMMVCGAGLPFLLASSTGMRFAPASAAGAVMVGSMPLFVALLSATIDGERFGLIRILGFLGVVVGIVLYISPSLLNIQPGAWIGFTLFLVGGALWAGYTMAFRGAGIGPWHAAAIINFGSLLALTPIYFLLVGTRLNQAAWSDILLQAFTQAVISAIAGLYFYGHSIRKLGASRAAVITSFTPVAVGLLGIPLLGEFPDQTGWIGIALVSLGVAFASAGPSRQK
jgi:drug/metabolite transporter (DMT)-like permease